jgi:hypothetical protein
MSEESDKRRAALAARLKASREEEQLSQKKIEQSKREKKALKALLPVFGISVSEINSAWRNDEEPLEELKYKYEGCGIEDFHVYLHNVESIKSLFSEDLKESGVWKYFVKVYDGRNYPLIVFNIKRNGLWVLTNRSPKQHLLLVPRICAYAKGKASDVSIMPLSTFIKENSDE